MVGGAGRLGDAVGRSLTEPCLDQFLQAALAVGLLEPLQESGQQGGDSTLHDPTGLLHAAIEEDGCHNGFEGIGQQRSPAAPSTLLLPVPQPQAGADARLLCKPGQTLLMDEGGPQAGQLPLTALGVTLKEKTAHQEPEDGIAEELEPFVVPGLSPPGLIEEGAVREGLQQELRAAEAVAKTCL
jgi:hypothetical protein